jgi:hypothetical protein
MANVTKKTTFLTALLSSLILVALASAASGDQPIRINTINPQEVFPGEAVQVYGGDATPGSVVTAKLVGLAEFIGLPEGAAVSNLTLGSAVAGETGDWQLDFITPLLVAGNYTLKVFDDRNIPSNPATFQVLANMTIVPVTNFTYGEVTNSIWPLYVTLTNISWPYVFGTNGTLPVLINNTLPVVTNTTVFFFVPFTAVPASGPSGMFVTVLGHHASGGEIQVYLNNTLVATVVGPSPGDWSTSFLVPSVPPGNYDLRAVDTEAGIISYASFYVTPQASSLPTALLLAIGSLPFLLLIGMVALAVLSGFTMLVLLAISTKRRKKSRPYQQDPRPRRL